MDQVPHSLKLVGDFAEEILKVTFIRVSRRTPTRAKVEIQSLNKRRQEYIATHTPKDASGSMLDDVMIKAIKDQANLKNLSW